MRERIGASKPCSPAVEYACTKREFKEMILDCAPQAAAAYIAIMEVASSWRKSVAMLDDRTIGLFMQAGATRFLPTVEARN